MPFHFDIGGVPFCSFKPEDFRMTFEFEFIVVEVSTIEGSIWGCHSVKGSIGQPNLLLSA